MIGPEGFTGVVAAVTSRQSELATALHALSPGATLGPTLLPGWNRLTVICHLRYGAEASHTMTLDVLAGKPTAFYPGGRTGQRPSTLVPRPEEQPSDVIRSFTETSDRLGELWATLDPEQWNLVVQEPPDNRDLGPISLGRLALLRLTEVEVHGHDLDIEVRPWSDLFVDSVLPMRARWLPARRSNNQPVDEGIRGTWILRPTDGSPFAITSAHDGVSVVEHDDVTGDVEIGGTKRDLLAFLLGRIELSHLSLSGDRDLAAAFHRAFPAP